jgi:hypothetical protein
MNDRAATPKAVTGFIVVPSAGIKVESVTDRRLEKLGERGPGWRDTNRGGWDATLPHYIAACI